MLAEQAPEDAVLAYIQSGDYPESEHTALAELLPATCPSIRKGIETSRKQVTNAISKLSRQSAPDVDGWIQQAQRLQEEIERSKAIAREVVQEAEDAAALRTTRGDHLQKSRLLKEEVEFNARLHTTLELARESATQIAMGQEAAAHGRLGFALEQHEATLRTLTDLRAFENTAPFELLTQRLLRLRENLEGLIGSRWDTLIHFEHHHQKLIISSGTHSGEQTQPQPDLSTTVDLASRLDLFASKLSRLCRDIEKTLIDPVLDTESAGNVFKLDISEESIAASNTHEKQTTFQLLDNLSGFVDFLDHLLPNEISVPLSEILMPTVVSRVIMEWLSSSIPTAIDAIPYFEALVERVNAFAEHLASVGWHGGADLNDWVQQGPKIWLAKRRETSLAVVRDVLSGRIKETKSVERVETQMVDRKDIIASTNGMGDDWDAAWGNDEDESGLPTPMAGVGADEDVSAWETDQDMSSESGHSTRTARTSAATFAGDGDNDEDAWGWDDQEAASPVKANTETLNTDVANPALNNGSDIKTQQEATLRETYTITAVPDEILSTIIQLTRDASDLQRIEHSASQIAAVAPALYSIPTLILAGYRALAQSFYFAINGGHMYLYNDTVRLASELTAFSSTLQTSDPEAHRRTKFTDDITALESFGKRAYGKEMESQRTILRDLLDGAQGFANSTEDPFSSECGNAVAMTVDRLRTVAKEWKPILSQSAWLQSMGSLLTTVVNKMLTDICDLSDISEAESTRLRQFCNEVGKVADLFTIEEQGEGMRDRTAIFTPSWIKFQYLGEILESSLADIKYLWKESELSLDFEAGEVVDLIEALFADSEHRRRAIAEIRRG